MHPNLNSWLSNNWTHHISNDNSSPLPEILSGDLTTWRSPNISPVWHCWCSIYIKGTARKSSEAMPTKVPCKLKRARWVKGCYYYEHSLDTCPLKWVFMLTQSQFKLHFQEIKRKWWRVFPLLERCEVHLLSQIRLFANSWAVADQAPSSMGFSRQEYWSGLPLPSPDDLLNPRIEPRSLTLQAYSLPLPSEPPGKS